MSVNLPDQLSVILLAPFCICEMNMVAIEMFLIVRILFELFIGLDVSEHHLAKTVEVCNIDHLWIDDFAHKRARWALVVNLDRT